jgi:hypothetical protein
MMTLFAAAQELPGEQREPFLRRECCNDDALYREVLSLLKAGDASGVLDDTRTMPESPAVEPEFLLANRFRILRRVGQGGMGEVYLADDLQLREQVAIKTIRPEIARNPMAVERFKREILLGKKVAHPNVCRIHDLGTAQGPDGAEMLFLSMQFLEGETLSSRIRRGPIPEGEAVPLIEQMAAGLLAAHREKCDSSRFQMRQCDDRPAVGWRTRGGHRFRPCTDWR